MLLFVVQSKQTASNEKAQAMLEKLHRLDQHHQGLLPDSPEVRQENDGDTGKPSNKDDSDLDLLDFDHRIDLVQELLVDDVNHADNDQEIQEQLFSDHKLISETLSIGSISHTAWFEEEAENEKASTYWSQFAPLPGPYCTEMIQAEWQG
jgi:hypothetical protein